MRGLSASGESYKITHLCRLFGVSKQAYYKHKENLDKAVQRRFIIEYVQTERAINPGLGGEKLWHMYTAYFGKEYSIGRDAFLDILRQHGLLLRRNCKRCRTTDSRHNFPLYPNLIKDLAIERANQVWGSDITYIRMSGGFCFLSLITDAYSRRIVGYEVAPTLEAEYTGKALAKALSNPENKNIAGLIHHSDRGCQYASFNYTTTLKQEGIQISMTENGDPKENAIAERVNGILKQEFLNHYQFTNIRQVKMAVAKAVKYYNHRRPHRSLDMMTPQQATQKQGKIPKRWKSYKDIYQQQSSTN